ncbi:MAG TPA: hypothetical protein VKI41_02910, partial [Vicinamibacteria bacterium]|nr:hypothetical protein [Vicinamibacteria bacterium]
GLRIIYHWAPSESALYMLYAYSKNDQGDLTPDRHGCWVGSFERSSIEGRSISRIDEQRSRGWSHSARQPKGVSDEIVPAGRRQGRSRKAWSVAD